MRASLVQALREELKINTINLLGEKGLHIRLTVISHLKCPIDGLDDKCNRT